MWPPAYLYLAGDSDYLFTCKHTYSGSGAPGELVDDIAVKKKGARFLHDPESTVGSAECAVDFLSTVCKLYVNHTLIAPPPPRQKGDRMSNLKTTVIEKKKCHWKKSDMKKISKDCDGKTSECKNISK